MVDMQNDFLEGGALAVPGGRSIIPTINRLVNHFEVVVYTQDWHPKGHKSFASSHAGREEGEVIMLDGSMQVLWPDHCVQGSQGAAFAEALCVVPHGVVFQKGTNPEVDSYSAFYDNRKIQCTGLADYLREHQVKRVFVCGLAADYCVKFSVLDALEEGFETVLVTDATRAVNVHSGDDERALIAMREAGALLSHSKEII